MRCPPLLVLKKYIITASLLALFLSSTITCSPSLALETSAYLDRNALAESNKSITLSFSGDILTHKSLYLKAKKGTNYDFNFAFENIRKLLVADVNFCQLETPLTKNTPTSYPVFRTPYQLASAIKYAGFDICSQASNHSLDAGIAGVKYTKKALQDAGVKSTGINDSEKNYTLIDFNGIKVAYLAYTYGTNGIKPAKGFEELVNIINLSAILENAKKAKEESDIVVLYMHWGQEYKEEITSLQKKLSDKLTASPFIDLIVGSHIHQLQKIDVINGKPVIYGLGNFWSGQGAWSGMPKGQISAVITIKLANSNTGYKFISGKASPTYVKPSNWSINQAGNNVKGQDRKVSCFSLKETARLFGKYLEVPDLC